MTRATKSSDRAALHDFELEENDDWSGTFAFVNTDDTPIGITGHTFELKIQSADGDTVVDLSSSIVRDDAQGEITFYATAAELDELARIYDELSPADQEALFQLVDRLRRLS